MGHTVEAVSIWAWAHQGTQTIVFPFGVGERFQDLGEVGLAPEEWEKGRQYCRNGEKEQIFEGLH
jgi:hypothetical protein